MIEAEGRKKGDVLSYRFGDLFVRSFVSHLFDSEVDIADWVLRGHGPRKRGQGRDLRPRPVGVIPSQTLPI